MTIDQATLGRRLRQAREACRVTQEAAAKALGLPRAAIARMEAGNRSVSTLELAELARLFRRDITWFLAEADAIAEEDALVVLCRVDPRLCDDSRVRQSVSRCLGICQEGARLEELLLLPRHLGPPAYRPDPPRSPADAVQQGERVAAEERRRMGIGDSPVADMPDLIVGQGVWASGAELPDGMSGLSLRHRSVGVMVLVDHRHSCDRKRFSYAHEYAHCLMDHSEFISVTTPENQENLVEVRANAFAAAFLMPEAGVGAYLNALDKGGPTRQTLHVYTPVGEPSEHAVEAQCRPARGSQRILFQDVVQLSRHFGVSYIAAVYRLKNQGRISEGECSTLLKANSDARTYLALLRLNEPAEADGMPGPDPRLVSQVAYLATEAYRRSLISRGKVLEISESLGIADGRRFVALAKAASE